MSATVDITVIIKSRWILLHHRRERRLLLSSTYCSCTCHYRRCLDLKLRFSGLNDSLRLHHDHLATKIIIIVDLWRHLIAIIADIKKLLLLLLSTSIVRVITLVSVVQRLLGANGLDECQWVVSSIGCSSLDHICLIGGCGDFNWHSTESCLNIIDRGTVYLYNLLLDTLDWLKLIIDKGDTVLLMMLLFLQYMLFLNHVHIFLRFIVVQIDI